MTATELDKLRKLASDPANALDIGKAAEHLVCADLIMQGYTAYLSDQGLPYDVVVDTGSGSLLRVQVKGTCFPRQIMSRVRAERHAYTFAVRKKGKLGLRRLDDSECDIIALAALDIKTVAYLPVAVAGQTVQIWPVGKADGEQGWLRDISQFPFEEAIDPSSVYHRIGRSHADSCVNGHVFADVGYYRIGGRRRCAVCARQSTAEARKRRMRKAEDPLAAVLG